MPHLMTVSSVNEQSHQQMANTIHLEIVRQGSEAWNDWFANNPNITPNLSGMSLAEVRLSGANLAGTVFANPDLTLADLSMTFLTNTELYGENLNSHKLYCRCKRITHIPAIDFCLTISRLPQEWTLSI